LGSGSGSGLGSGSGSGSGSGYRHVEIELHVGDLLGRALLAQRPIPGDAAPRGVRRRPPPLVGRAQLVSVLGERRGERRDSGRGRRRREGGGGAGVARRGRRGGDTKAARAARRRDRHLRRGGRRDAVARLVHRPRLPRELATLRIVLLLGGRGRRGRDDLVRVGVRVRVRGLVRVRVRRRARVRLVRVRVKISDDLLAPPQLLPQLKPIVHHLVRDEGLGLGLGLGLGVRG